MVMTHREIKGKFERADNKKQIVRVLAELNGCSTEDILEALRTCDIPENELPKFRTAKAKKEFEKAELKEIVEVGIKEAPEKTKGVKVPQIVKDFVNEELNRITKEIEVLNETIKGYENQRDELCDFLEGSE